MDAEEECVNHGAHLWSINSHREWNDIFLILGSVKRMIFDDNSRFKRHSFVSFFFFIGMVRINENTISGNTQTEIMR